MSITNENDNNEKYNFNNDHLKVAYENAEELLANSNTISDFIEESINEVNNGSSFEEVLFNAIVSGYRTAIIQLDILYSKALNFIK